MRSVAAASGGVLLLLPLVASALVYGPVLMCQFVDDDFLNLFRIVNWPLAQYVLVPFGGHLLVTRNVLFYLFYQLFGAHAAAYFSLVLATHLLNVYLLFRVIDFLTESRHLAAFGAMLWGTCPFHAGTLGWYSVYGQVVAAAALLLLLRQSARLVHDGAMPPRSALVWWPLALLLASTSFGVGIGITFAAPAAFFLLLPASRRRTQLVGMLCVVAA